MMTVARDVPAPLPPEATAVLEALRRDRGELSALAVSRALGTSTLVVIPALQALVEHGLVTRRSVGQLGGGAAWAYRQTVRGARRATTSS